MGEYINLLFKTIILYFFLIIVLRIMGKRELGELSLFDVAVIFIISEILSISISNTSKSILFSIIPIIIIVFLELIVSKICFRNEKIRNLIYGKSIVIIENGKINVELMIKERYNINDLLNQLHEHNIASPSEIKFAILESNGKISIFDKNSIVKWPEPIIKDGKINYELIKKLKINKEKLIKEINNRGYYVEKILICILLEDDLYIQEKMFFNNKWIIDNNNNNRN